MSGMKSSLAVWIWINIAVLKISVYSVQENGTYEVTSSSSTWDKACFDNGPAEIDGIQLDPLNLPMNVNLSSITGRGRVWIGYYQRFNYFNLLGCLSSGAELHFSIIGNTPGRCAMACSNFKFIGLEENICYCLNFTSLGSIQFKNSSACSMKMCNGTNFVCGARDQMWVYGVNFGNTSYFDQLGKNSDYSNKCVSMHYKVYGGGATWNFANCQYHHNSLCVLNDSAIDFAQYKSMLQETWSEAARICFNKSEMPASIEFSNFRHYNLEEFTEAWTAYIRDEVIQKKGQKQSLHGRMKCVSLSVQGGTPKFALEDCQNTLPSVCLAGITTARTNILTTTTTRTTRTAAAVEGVTSISTTTSSPVIILSSQQASSLPTSSSSSILQSSDKITNAESATQLISIRNSNSTIWTSTFQGNESIITNTGITTARTNILTTTTTRTTRTAAAVEGVTSISTTTSSPVIILSSQQASSLPTSSSSSILQSSDKITNAESATQLISIRNSNSTIWTSTFQANESVITNTEIPILGWLGIGIGILLVFVIFSLIILRYKRIRSSLSSKTAADHSNSGDKLLNGIAMDEVGENKANVIEDRKVSDVGNELKMQPDPDFGDVQFYTTVQHRNGRQAKSVLMTDKEVSATHLYATVVIGAKHSPNINDKGQASSDSIYDSTYDATYAQKPEAENNDGDYNHIYDHASLKLPPTLP